MNLFENLWVVYKVCVMLGAGLTQAKKLRESHEQKAVSKKRASLHLFTVGANRWVVHTYLIPYQSI